MKKHIYWCYQEVFQFLPTNGLRCSFLSQKNCSCICFLQSMRRLNIPLSSKDLFNICKWCHKVTILYTRWIWSTKNLSNKQHHGILSPKLTEAHGKGPLICMKVIIKSHRSHKSTNPITINLSQHITNFSNPLLFCFYEFKHYKFIRYILIVCLA